ncbi:MAG TPA: acyl-CoA thioesterase, partial [Nocardioidaceae bacterium]
MSLSDPLFARPMGERVAETITASGMEETPIFSGSRAGGAGRVRRHPDSLERIPLPRDVRDATSGSGRIGPVRHVYDCPLRWADMDSLGHVNNVTYVDYLQEARVDMFAVHAPWSGGEELAEGV